MSGAVTRIVVATHNSHKVAELQRILADDLPDAVLEAYEGPEAVEDVRAETDMNVVVTGRGLFVEVQGTAEGAPFDRAELNALLDLALAGAVDLAEIQTTALTNADGSGPAIAGSTAVSYTGV